MRLSQVSNCVKLYVGQNMFMYGTVFCRECSDAYLVCALEEPVGQPLTKEHNVCQKDISHIDTAVT